MCCWAKNSAWGITTSIRFRLESLAPRETKDGAQRREAAALGAAAQAQAELGVKAEGEAVEQLEVLLDRRGGVIGWVLKGGAGAGQGRFEL